MSVMKFASRDEFFDALFSNQALYFDFDFMKENKIFWGPFLTRENLNEFPRLIDAFFQLRYIISIMYLYDTFKRSYIDRTIPPSFCNDKQCMVITPTLTFVEFEDNFVLPSDWICMMQDETQNLLIRLLS